MRVLNEREIMHLAGNNTIVLWALILFYLISGFHFMSVMTIFLTAFAQRELTFGSNLSLRSVLFMKTPFVMLPWNSNFWHSYLLLSNSFCFRNKIITAHFYLSWVNTVILSIFTGGRTYQLLFIYNVIWMICSTITNNPNKVIIVIMDSDWILCS